MITPARITFHMRTAMVVPSTDKALDAILSWAAVQQGEFDDVDDPIACQHNIGIGRHEAGGQWCFMASNLSVDWLGETSMLHYTQRQRLMDYGDAWNDGLLLKRPSFDMQRGLTKGGSYLQPTRWATLVTAYAMVEDMARLQELLPWVTHIGKLHHKDHGAVQSFEIVEDSAAESRWSQRSLPVNSPHATKHIRAIGALVSPYWKRENHTEVMMPAN